MSDGNLLETRTDWSIVGVSMHDLSVDRQFVIP